MAWRMEAGKGRESAYGREGSHIGLDRVDRECLVMVSCTGGK